jgi:hypothetical protein
MKKRLVLGFVTALTVGVIACVLWFLFSPIDPLPPVHRPPPPNRLSSGYVIGANYPWLNYGFDFGDSQLGHLGISTASGAARLEQDFAQLSAHGVRLVRLFVLCDGRSGLRFDGSGNLIGLDDYVLQDLQQTLEIAQRHDIQLILVLLDFKLFGKPKKVDGLHLGGRGSLLRTAAGQDAFIQKVFVPMFKRFGRHPYIAAWEIMNEPEWVITVWGVKQRLEQMPVAVMQEFVRKSVAAVHEHTIHYATVGSASRLWLHLWKDSGLDVLQYHYYPWMEVIAPLNVPAAQISVKTPVIIGEFPSKRGPWSMQHYLRVGRDGGYRAALFWSYNATDQHTDGQRALRGIDAWRRQPPPRKP